MYWLGTDGRGLAKKRVMATDGMVGGIIWHFARPDGATAVTGDRIRVPE